MFTKFAIAASFATAAITTMALVGCNKHDVPPGDKQQTPAQTSAQPSAPESDNPLDALSGGTDGDKPTPAATSTPATSKVKITGNWHGFDTYNYRFVGARGDGDTTFPLTIDGIAFPDELALAAATQPVGIDSQHATGVSCNFFCWNDQGTLLGYNPTAYAALARRQGKPETPVVAAAAPVTDVDRVDGSTSSDVPTGVIRSAINANNDLTSYKSAPVQTWTETNTYTRKVNDETVVIIEIHGTFHVTPAGQAEIDRLPAYGKPNSSYVKDGQVALVKRGNSWYIFKG